MTTTSETKVPASAEETAGSRAWGDLKIAVLVPCFNEAATIAEVVNDFQAALPNAAIYVYDNNSTDGTAGIARRAGAYIGTETRQGKGNVVHRMFADIEADIYIVVDGDGTYHAPSAPALVRLLLDGPYDIVNAARLASSEAAYRRGHRWGNAMLSRLVKWFFGEGTSDMLSGYKVLSRRFVRSFPALSSGFEIETELVVHALELRMPMAEVETPYVERTAGSTSKLHTYRDGFRILRLIARLLKEERPFQFFGLVSLVLLVLGTGVGTPVVITYIESGLVPRFPTAILATGLVLLAFLAFFSGLILETVTRGRREMKGLFYMQLTASRSYARERMS